MTTYIPKSETITGTDLTGASGTANRTYELGNDDATVLQMQILVSEAILQNTINFTFDSDLNTITFLNEIWDDQPISLDYFVTSTTPASGGPYYCDTLQAVQFSGIGVAIELESLGTGDASNKSFDTDKGNIIDGSYTVYYGATGDDANNLSEMTEGTHYTIFKDDGRILLLTAGVTALSTNELYISYTYSPKQSDTILATYLPMAQAEVDKLTGNYWGTDKTSIQYFDGYDSGYPQTNRPFGFQIEEAPEFELDYKGITSITTVEYLSRTGTVDMTVDSDYISLDDEGRVVLNSQSIPNGKRNIKITFIHGYDTVPVLIQELCALVTGMMALVNISGGSYKDISTYSLGRKNFSRGQVYVNIRESIDQMKARILQITEDMGPRFFCV